MKKKTFYYHPDMKDDFGSAGKNGKPLKDNFKYIHHNIFYRFFSWILYYILAFPILWLVSKIAFGVKVKNKKYLKKELKKKEGVFFYSNHCHCADAYLSHVFFGVPRRTYVISHSDPVNIPVVGTLVMMLGCLPLPNSKKTFRNYNAAMKERVEQGAMIAVYPEGTLWPYYNGMRPFEKTSFKYAAMYHQPIVVCAETFRKPKIFKKGKPRMTLTLSHVLYPDENLSVEENTEKFYEFAVSFWKEHVENKSNYGFHTYLPIEEKKEE